MKVQITDKDGRVLKERKVREEQVAPGVKKIDVMDLFAALSGRP